MKNFQQTPRQRRVAMSNSKQRLRASKPVVFQPREAWSSKRKLGGVALSLVEEKQIQAGHMGVLSDRYPCHRAIW